MGSALNASFGSHSLVLKNEAKRDPSTSSGKAFIGPRSARLCGTSMFDSNLPLTERYEELLISIRSNYSRKGFLIRSLFGKIKKLVL